MRDVIIKSRTESEGRKEDIVLYAEIHVLVQEHANALREAGELTDHEIIAICVRAIQQMACNATEIAEHLEVSLEVAVD